MSGKTNKGTLNNIFCNTCTIYTQLIWVCAMTLLTSNPLFKVIFINKLQFAYFLQVPGKVSDICFILSDFRILNIILSTILMNLKRIPTAISGIRKMLCHDNMKMQINSTSFVYGAFIIPSSFL